MMSPTPVVEAVEVPATKIQIPMGLNPGESFIVTPENGRAFSVCVPQGAKGGDFIEITLPEDPSTQPEKFVTISKATFGAAIAGGVVGTVVFGPVGGIVLAAGAAYCTTREHGKIGEYSRKVGNGVYNGMVKTKNWVEKKMFRSMRGQYEAVPAATVVPDKKEMV